MNLNPLEMMQFVQANAQSEAEQLHMLAALADAPAEDYQAKISTSCAK